MTDGPPVPDIRPCSGWGLPSHPGHPGCWCALTAPFHPYLCPGTGPSAVCSLWHFPAGRPDWPLASTLPCGVPTFLSPVVPEDAGPRSPGRLTIALKSATPDAETTRWSSPTRFVTSAPMAAMAHVAVGPWWSRWWRPCSCPSPLDRRRCPPWRPRPRRCRDSPPPRRRRPAAVGPATALRHASTQRSPPTRSPSTDYDAVDTAPTPARRGSSRASAYNARTSPTRPVVVGRHPTYWAYATSTGGPTDAGDVVDRPRDLDRPRRLLAQPLQLRPVLQRRVPGAAVVVDGWRGHRTGKAQWAPGVVEIGRSLGGLHVVGGRSRPSLHLGRPRVVPRRARSSTSPAPARLRLRPGRFDRPAAVHRQRRPAVAAPGSPPASPARPPAKINSRASVGDGLGFKAGSSASHPAGLGAAAGTATVVENPSMI